METTQGRSWWWGAIPYSHKVGLIAGGVVSIFIVGGVALGAVQNQPPAQRPLPAPITTSAPVRVTTPSPTSVAPPASPPAPAPTTRQTTAAPPPPPAATPTLQGVTPGAFCSEHWWYGRTSAGTLMQCKTSPTDSRFRWRAA